MEEVKTSSEWQELCKIEVLDPDGWDRSPGKYQFSWHEEKTTRQEFEKRLTISTCQFPKGAFTDGFVIWKDLDKGTDKKFYYDNPDIS